MVDRTGKILKEKGVSKNKKDAKDKLRQYCSTQEKQLQNRTKAKQTEFDEQHNKLYRYWVLQGLEQSKKRLQESSDTDSSENKRQLNYLRQQITIHYIKNIFLFPIWFIKLLVPSFLKGTPNIWTNIKQIAAKKEFHPLRMAMLSWLVFTYLLIQGGLFYFHRAPITEAASFTWLQTDWSGNPDGGTNATHTSNRTGWTQYSSLTGAYVSSTGQMNLATSTYTATDGLSFTTTGNDTGGDFDSGSNSNTVTSTDGLKLAVASSATVNNWDTVLLAVPKAVGAGARMIRNGTDDLIYVLIGNSTLKFYSYSIAGNSWTELTDIPATAVNDGAQMIRSGSSDTIYVVPAYNTTTFVSYSIANNTWTALTVIPAGAGAGAQMIRNGTDDTIYLLRGDNTQVFYSYSISGNTWTTLTAVPMAAAAGSSLLRNGADDVIYYSRGGSAGFYSYSIAGNTWTTLTSPPFAASTGSNTLRDGSSDTVYLLTGNGGTGFYSYSISGNTWTTLTVIPGAAGSGTQMIRNGSDDTIYVLRGNSQTSFYSYSISGNTWSTLTVLPGAAQAGAQMIRAVGADDIYIISGLTTYRFQSYSIAGNTWTSNLTSNLASVIGSTGVGGQMIRNGTDDKIYLLRGGGQTSFYSYSISGDTWTTLTVTPGSISAGAQMIRNGSDDTIYVLRGLSQTTFYSYSIANNTWTTLTAAPGGAAAGSSLLRNGADDVIYYSRGGTAGFYSYSIAGNTWTTLTAPPVLASTGSNTIRAGSSDTIYLLTGNSGTGFYSYSISGDTWTTLTVVPGTIGAGAQMIRNGTDDTIYVLRGASQTSFYSYSISGDTWTTLASLSGTNTVGAGAQLIRNGSDDTIYVLRGNSKPNLDSYSISGNSWTVLIDTPVNNADGSFMIRATNAEDIYVLPNGQTAFYKFMITATVYQSSGTFTSNAIDIGASEFDTITFTSTSAFLVGDNSITFQIASNNDNSSWTYLGPDGTAGTYYGPTSTAISVDHDGNRYLKYQINLQTTNTSQSPEVTAVAFAYTSYIPSATATSSVFDTESENIISSLAWTENLNTNGDLRFQIKTSPDNSTWTNWLGPTSTDGYYTDPAGGETINSSHGDGADDRYIQYQITLTTTNGAVTPVLSDVSLTYVVNGSPQISGSGVTATQLSNGTISITWGAYDSDTGTATTSFQYSLDNGDNWSDVLGHLSSSATTTRLISSWTTSTVIWDARQTIDGQDVSQAMIKVIENDGELANSTVSSTSASFALDVKTPLIAASTPKVVATTTPATIYNSVTDTNSIEMISSLSSDLSGASWEAYASSDTITLATSPDTVYIQYRDSFFNTSSLQTITTPNTPANMIIRDISNTGTSDYKEFIAWSTVDAPALGFNRYDIWRSTDGTNYTLLATTTDRTTNYYVNTGLALDTTYYYKVSSVDNNWSASSYSSVVSDNANGQGGTDQTAPTVSSITTSTITTTGFKVTWNTDEVSSSSVAVSATSFGGSFTTTTVNTMVQSSSSDLGEHSVTVSGLTAGTSYYFQVASTDPTGNIIYDNNGGLGYNVETLSGPEISGISTQNVNNNGATIVWNTNTTASSSVYYSVSSDLSGSTQTTDTNLVTAHSVALTGLLQATKYYYYVESNNAIDNNAGNYYIFTTASDTTGPVITSVSASPVADTTAVITWTTDEASTSHILYGTSDTPTNADGNYSTLSTALDTNHSVTLTGLAVETIYNFFVASVDASGNPTTSTKSSFTTLETLSEESDVVAREAVATAAGQVTGAASVPSAPRGGGGAPPMPVDIVPPAISNVRATKITSESAVIEWSTDEAGDSAAQFGKDISYKSASVDFSSLKNKHSLELFNLVPSTLYNYRASTADKSGNRSYSANFTFNTLSGFEELDTLQDFGEGATPEEGSPESIFKNLIDKTADIIRRMSGQVSIDTLESGLATQYTTIRELGRLVPLPLIGGQPVVEVGATYARIFWTTDKASNSLVALAPDSTYQNNQEYTQVVGDATEQVDNHEVLISELKPNTTYHYQVRSKTPVSDTAKSRDFIFKTKEEQVEIITYKIESVSDTEALFTWITNVPTDSKITYIPYSSDGTLQIDSARSAYNKAVSSLHEVRAKEFEAGLVYQVEISGEDLDGNIISKTLSTFSTSETDAPPVITQVQTDAALLPGDQAAVQAIISWLTNEPATSQVFYQRGFGQQDEKKEFAQKTPFEPNYLKRHIMVITNFDPGAVYQFQLESTDSSGNTTRSRTFTILTPRQKESVLQVIMSNLEETFSWVGQLGL